MAERVDHWKESFEDLRPILKTFYCHQIHQQQSANPQITSDWFAFTDYGNDSNKHITC